MTSTSSALGIALASLLCCSGCSDGGEVAGTGGVSATPSPGSGATTGAGGGVAPAAGGMTGAAGGAVGSGAAPGTGGTSGTTLLQADFQARAVGLYAEAMVAEDFGFAATWNNGLDEGRASVVDEGGEKFLRVAYPQGVYGPGDTGIQFKVPFGQAYAELYFSYRVRFGVGFDFVKGGKLPGLIGGTAPTGCQPKPDGFSARNMWRTSGHAVQYVYHPLKQSGCGDDLDYQVASTDWNFTPGTWHTVRHRIVMNEQGAANGVMQAWVDEQLVLDDQGRTWIVDDYPEGNGIDALYVSTFLVAVTPAGARPPTKSLISTTSS